MTSNNHNDYSDRMYRENKALMELAAQMEEGKMLKRESLVRKIPTGNRAERRRQAAQARKAKP